MYYHRYKASTTVSVTSLDIRYNDSSTMMLSRSCLLGWTRLRVSRNSWIRFPILEGIILSSMATFM